MGLQNYIFLAGAIFVQNNALKFKFYISFFNIFCDINTYYTCNVSEKIVDKQNLILISSMEYKFISFRHIIHMYIKSIH